MPGTLGSALSSLGNVAPGFLGGGTGGWMGNAGSSLSNWANTTPMDPGTGALPNAAGGIPTPPSDTTFTESTAGPSASPFNVITGAGGLPSELPATSISDGSSGGGMAPPFGTPAPAAFGAPVNVNPSAGSPTDGTPADTGFWHSLLFGSPATGTAAAGTGPGKGGWPGLFSPAGMSGIAAGSTDLLKYLQQRSLLNPSDINSAANQLAKNQAAMLKKSIFPAITATGQETGQINSPYLMSQAYTAAAAPIVAQINEAALNQWLQANQIAGGMYPQTPQATGPVSANIFGGGAAA